MLLEVNQVRPTDVMGSPEKVEAHGARFGFWCLQQGVEGLVEFRLKLLNGFEADGYADQHVCDSHSRSINRRHELVRSHGRVRHRRAGVGQGG